MDKRHNWILVNKKTGIKVAGNLIFALISSFTQFLYSFIFIIVERENNLFILLYLKFSFPPSEIRKVFNKNNPQVKS